MLDDKIKGIEQRFDELEGRLSDPAVIANQREYTALAKERSQMAEVAGAVREYRKVSNEIEEYKSYMDGDDADMRELAKGEMPELQRRLAALEEKIRVLLTPRDPNDDKNVILEIRAGTGGAEASLFAAELFRLYTRYAERHRWKVETLSMSDTGLGGIKEVVASINGKGAYSRLKYEGGVHRVQRVPATEASGRIHTSAVTVVVMPEADEVEININEEKDLRIDVMRASGPGGQSVNTTDSAVRITHIPSGMVIICRDEKSQHKNKARALKILRARLLDKANAEQDAKIAAQRKSMVGTGDRSERIRTYNFPQSRVTDHRVNLTLHQLDQVLDGDIDTLIDALTTQEQAEALSALASSLYASRCSRTKPLPRRRDDRKKRVVILADAGIDTARLDAEVLLAHACGVSRATLLAGLAVDADAAEKISPNDLPPQAAREPVAYIIGCKEFFSLDFEVTPGRSHSPARDRNARRGRAEVSRDASRARTSSISAPVRARSRLRSRRMHKKRKSKPPIYLKTALEVARRNAIRHRCDDSHRFHRCRSLSR